MIKTVRIGAEMRLQACSSLLCSSSGLAVTERVENKRPAVFFRPARMGFLRSLGGTRGEGGS